ncbi:MAG: hypothetical protein Q9N02_04870 [Ghiorsea sp.]|nr:hypothetical protein [Ghiorsea sp.]
MAIPVSPSSGFITRLLQQTSQHSTTAPHATPNKSASRSDVTSFSNAARQAHNNDNQQLETKLLELYNHKGQGQR